jgi:hypothetical protein
MSPIILASEINSMFKFLTDLPVWVKILLCFTVIPIYIFKDSIGAVIKTISLKNLSFFKKEKKLKNMEDLLVHDFFLSLDNVHTRVKQVDFSHKNELNFFKRKMMLKLIELKATSIKKFFIEILKDPNTITLNNQEFKFKVIQCITQLIKEYNEQAVQYYLKMGVSSKDAHYFVNSYESYRETIITSFVDRLESITISKQYDDNYERMLAMFEVLTVAIEVIPRDVKSLYFIINGKYDKYNIKEKIGS